jgi:hypothetical protein
MTQPTRKMNASRLMTLFIAFLGCVVTAVPVAFSLAEPIPLTLIGCGVTTVALALFLFFSL